MKNFLCIFLYGFFFIMLGGCASTGYRSEVVYQFLENKKYKMSFKVFRISKSMFGGIKETLVYDAPDRVWELGLPGIDKTNWGGDQVSIYTSSFVPSDNKNDYVFKIEVKEDGIIKHESQFIFKQTRN